MDGFRDVMRSLPWFAWVGIVAILAAATKSIIRSFLEHEQRMAMIKQGMHPGAPKDED